ncbi:MAG: tetratricopeptide repeat protein [Magnetovibrio sp.]|nr:tetratricopeptide repeat protein [Magnetovibrio sp.]
MSLHTRTWRGAVFGAAVIVLSACQTTSTKTPETEPLDGVQRTLFQAGRDSELAHKYEAAAGAYGRLSEMRPNDPAVLASFLRNMRYSGRARDVLKYLDDKPQELLSDKDVQFEQAKAYLAAGKKNEALMILRTVQEKLPGDWRVYSALGITLDALALYDDAQFNYQKALAISPNNEVVLNNLAMSLAMTGKLKAAIEALETAAGVNRNNQQIRQNLALLYAINGQVDRAKTLAAMDLDAGDLETNMSFYRRFERSPQ